MSIDAERLWVAIGLLGQGLFALRFLIQWTASEKQRRPVLPMPFWWFSIGGGLCLLSYSIWRVDPVFILGQATGLLIYARNMVLARRQNQLLEG